MKIGRVLVIALVVWALLTVLRYKAPEPECQYPHSRLNINIFKPIPYPRMIKVKTT